MFDKKMEATKALLGITDKVAAFTKTQFILIQGFSSFDKDVKSAMIRKNDNNNNKI